MLIDYKGMSSTRALREQQKNERKNESKEGEEDERRIFTAHSSLPPCIDVPR